MTLHLSELQVLRQRGARAEPGLSCLHPCEGRWHRTEAQVAQGRWTSLEGFAPIRDASDPS